jgi:hypothetical protein
MQIIAVIGAQLRAGYCVGQWQPTCTVGRGTQRQRDWPIGRKNRPTLDTVIDQ